MGSETLRKSLENTSAQQRRKSGSHVTSMAVTAGAGAAGQGSDAHTSIAYGLLMLKKLFPVLSIEVLEIILQFYDADITDCVDYMKNHGWDPLATAAPKQIVPSLSKFSSSHSSPNVSPSSQSLGSSQGKRISRSMKKHSAVTAAALSSSSASNIAGTSSSGSVHSIFATTAAQTPIAELPDTMPDGTPMPAKLRAIFGASNDPLPSARSSSTMRRKKSSNNLKKVIDNTGSRGSPVPSPEYALPPAVMPTKCRSVLLTPRGGKVAVPVSVGNVDSKGRSPKKSRKRSPSLFASKSSPIACNQGDRKRSTTAVTPVATSLGTQTALSSWTHTARKGGRRSDGDQGSDEGHVGGPDDDNSNSIFHAETKHCQSVTELLSSHNSSVAETSEAAGACGFLDFVDEEELILQACHDVVTSRPSGHLTQSTPSTLSTKPSVASSAERAPVPAPAVAMAAGTGGPVRVMESEGDGKISKKTLRKYSSMPGTPGMSITRATSNTNIGSNSGDTRLSSIQLWSSTSMSDFIDNSKIEAPPSPPPPQQHSPFKSKRSTSSPRKQRSDSNCSTGSPRRHRNSGSSSGNSSPRKSGSSGDSPQRHRMLSSDTGHTSPGKRQEKKRNSHNNNNTNSNSNSNHSNNNSNAGKKSPVPVKPRSNSLSKFKSDSGRQAALLSLSSPSKSTRKGAKGEGKTKRSSSMSEPQSPRGSTLSHETSTGSVVSVDIHHEGGEHEDNMNDDEAAFERCAQFVRSLSPASERHVSDNDSVWRHTDLTTTMPPPEVNATGKLMF
eukprot:TRINITY_DN4390_c1_g1_i1.p1 TRINITY_DN4390_c1_g1~~TRINITY_DN4390_c1_g1_i1.p1  ORF type:complete len:781 (-),score=158.23 TRINITY_DN4390_c1_g1_i1:7-2349(-)